jgi:hypothetical protein
MSHSSVVLENALFPLLERAVLNVNFVIGLSGDLFEVLLDDACVDWHSVCVCV